MCDTHTHTHTHTHWNTTWPPKKNKIFPSVTTWMDHEVKEKDKYCVISCIYGILKTKESSQRQRTQWWLPEEG